MKVNFDGLNQPKEDDYLWRYIKPERIKSFVEGELYFPALLDFNDSHEALTPFHHALFKFLTINAGRKFDLDTSIGEQDAETVTGTIMMWMALYDLEKKLTTLELVKKSDEIPAILHQYLGNPNILHNPHLDVLTAFYSSCWFVGNYEESALMWTSYSSPGGVAVRIKFSDFKKSLSDYFGSKIKNNDGIATVWSGLINYVDHDAEFEEWNNKIKSGTPLAFFKQHYYKQESEYRILLERDVFTEPREFKRLHPIFNNLTNYDIILHPSSWHDEFTTIKGVIPNDKKVRINYSKLRFNK